MKLNILITSGPTREYIDPVRFISNASSGMMGSALARAALARGLEVVLITGPVNVCYPKGAKIVPVISALEMLKAAKRFYGTADIIIGAAAVSDYRPKKFVKNKLKKNSRGVKLSLVENPDILKVLGKNKKGKALIGFALETSGLTASAKKKLKEKNLDLIVANSEKSIGKNKTTVYIVNRNGLVKRLSGVDKKAAAKRIIDESVRIFKDIKSGKARD